MAVDSGILTKGTTFEISDDGGTTWENFGCVTGWTQDVPARAEIETTCLSDTAKTYKFGLKDNGTYSFEMMYDRGQGFLDLEASYDSDTAYDFRITLSTAEVFSFKGFVMSISHTGSQDDVIRSTVEVKVSGNITEA